MIQNYQQNNSQIIFVNMNITIINITKDKIDELNKCFKMLDKNLEHNLFNNNKEIGKMVIEIISIMEMIFDDSNSEKWQIETYNNPFKQAIESGLFFLEYINNKILKQKLIDIKIYNEFDNFITNNIESLIHNKKQFLFELYIYKWLKKENYINSNQSFSRYNEDNNNSENEELTNFYNKYHREILDWIIKNPNHLQENPLRNEKNRIYYNLLNSYKQIKD